MACRRLVMSILLCGCVVLVGCPAKQDVAVDDTATKEPAIPSVKYLPMDAPPGMSQAVVVDGYPLVYTRQLGPIDKDGRLPGSTEEQVEQVMANLQAVLGTAGSGLDQVVRLHVYADTPQTADLVCEHLSQLEDTSVRPAITSVVTPLPSPGGQLAVDAVATTNQEVDKVEYVNHWQVTSAEAQADAAILPAGGVVYLSGQPDKSPLPDAVGKSLDALFDIIDQLKLDRAHIAQMKVFIDSADDAPLVLQVMQSRFPDRRLPPVAFVEWIASAPVEIEMVVHLPLTSSEPAETVRYYNPPGVKPSPTFSRVAVVETPRQIFISGLSARAAGNGVAQVRDVFAQLQDVLSETGSDLNHLAKATYYVSDEDASTMLNKLRPEFYDPQRPPAASKAMVHGVAQPERSLTIDMIAVGCEP